MYMLVLQTFLLMMAAFLLGCTISCIVKRSFNRVVAADAPADLLRVDVPPPVQRTAPEPVAAPRAAVDVAPGETQRFERALAGDAVAPPSTSAAAPSGPMIEVQAPPAYNDVREDTSSGLAAAAAAAAAASAAAAYAGSASTESSNASRRDATWTRVELTPEPAAAPPVTEDGDSYNAIAVASHDGSMLPPPGVLEVQLPPPEMPLPPPPPEPVPLVDIPAAIRPDDAPDAPDPNYVAEALAAGYDYVEQPEADAPDFDLPQPTDAFEYPPEGESYASVAAGGDEGAAVDTATEPAPDADAGGSTYVAEYDYVETPSVQADGFELPQPTDEFAHPPEGSSYASVAQGGEASTSAPDAEPAYETKSTHVSTALAAAAGLAAERAAAGQHSSGPADDLTRINGIDGVLAARLNYAGVSRFAEIASWNADDVRRMSQALGFFGRIEDEYWIGQARLLVGKQEEQPDEYALADDTPPTVNFATPADAAGIATAAAAAAAAAMVSYASRPPERSTPREEAPQTDDASTAADPQDGTANDEPLAGGEPADGEGDSVSRSDLAGLRSVRSEGLLGEDAEYARSTGQEDLKRIRGIGVLIEKKLNSLGISSYEQVANWSAADIERISELLDFKGRIERENWIEQARILASGGQTEFSRRVDRGEV